MNRLRPVTLGLAGSIVLALCAVPLAAAQPGAAPPARGKAAFHNSRAPVCQSGLSLCTDPYDNPSGTYVGHDEPSVEFKSDVPGSGNDITYTITLPDRAAKLPTQQRRPARRGTSSCGRRSGSA